MSMPFDIANRLKHSTRHHAGHKRRNIEFLLKRPCAFHDRGGTQATWHKNAVAFVAFYAAFYFWRFAR